MQVGAAAAVCEPPVVLSGWVEPTEVAGGDPLLRLVAVAVGGRDTWSAVGVLALVVMAGGPGSCRGRAAGLWRRSG